MKSKTTLVLLFISSFISHAQTLKGQVFDAKTKVPLESVSVYFDNTTIGTTTNEKGEFSISYNKAVQSDLIISFLGYEKQYISDYRTKEKVLIELVESAEQLGEVVINTNDGLTRKQKLKIFRAQFLGTSKYARKCKILNEDDLILKYNKKSRQLTVSAIAPLEIENKVLKYHITYELVDFEVIFNYIELFKNDFSVYSTFYSGSSFYKDEINTDDKSVLKQRQKVYEGSIQHFMRAVYNKRLKEEKYRIFKRGFGVKEAAHIFVEDTTDPNYKKVSLSGKLTVLFKGKDQSDIIPKTEAFYVDQYGNFLPVRALFFNGEMGSMRVGDTLPLDYGISKN
ncbi:carboxypeptidase-like regulatory domain-containing protein [Winogradskyella litorisediminis]|uniref:Carboxypeptidase-like regulatory domain-containing protein n=1 Tax=Winogradskyella litorisediminis TaxID=1156618 RepID=A0ABW3N522_9FLAO